MENNPSLDELLNYGDDYQYPDLILSDYFRVDNTRKDKQSSTPPSQDQRSSEQTSSDKSQEQDSNEQATEEDQEQSSSEQTSSDKSQEQDSDEQATEEDQEQSSSSEKSSGDKSQNQDSDELSTEEENQEQSSSEKTSVDKPQEQDSNEQATEEDQEQSPSEKSSNDKSQEQATEEDQEQDSDEQTTDEKFQEQDSDEQATEEDQEQSSSEKSSNDKSQEQATEENQEQDSDEQTTDDKLQEQDSDEQTTDEKFQEQDSDEQDEKNNFDDLLDNYEESERRDSTNEHQDNFSASEKINDITTTKIYKVLKRLVSLSYERFQKGTYKYDKKEILKHYLTNQKFRIIDDLISPTFKPDVYVFDLSPSNNDSLEMYVNAIGSVAVKDSIIYLTYNECILRKLLIKKESSHGIDVGKVVNSSNKTYSNFDCTIFSEYRSFYEELHEIKDRKIYIFSDFDISRDISRLSQENPNIVWFSTEKDGGNQGFFFREYPSTYIGYYVETTGIEDIEKFINEKNKTKYKRRFM